MQRKAILIQVPEFKHMKLEFLEDRIIPVLPDNLPFQIPLEEVMMDWEDHLMKRHAEIVCENGGDILEIGFGMGISANYIQEQNPKSHTIVEIHPQIIEKLEEWAADKPNVNIVRGDWYENLNNLGVYDGIFYDGFRDPNLHLLKDSLLSLSKPGTIITFWNSLPEKKNYYNFENTIYEEMNANPPDNRYYNGDKYYLPKVIVHA